jgi:uncharacterized membrane protein
MNARQKKSWLADDASQLSGFYARYVNLVPIVMMMTVVAVIAVSVGPVV